MDILHPRAARVSCSRAGSNHAALFEATVRAAAQSEAPRRRCAQPVRAARRCRRPRAACAGVARADASYVRLLSMLRRLYGDNYKCLVNLTRRLEGLCGPNGSGKSAVFEASYVIRQLRSGAAQATDCKSLPASTLARWQTLAQQSFECKVALAQDTRPSRGGCPCHVSGFRRDSAR